MKPASSNSALKVQRLLGPEFEVVEFDVPTRTAADAAGAIGCEVAQIAKSLIFKAADGAPVLVIASGSNRVDEAKVAETLGQPIGRADAEFVRQATGFAIGGVPPVGHTTAPVILLDDDLRRHQVIWAAAGTPNAVFRTTPARLGEITGGRFAEIKA